MYAICKSGFKIIFMAQHLTTFSQMYQVFETVGLMYKFVRMNL